MLPGFHLAVFPVMFFPFALFAALATPFIWRHRKDPRFRFCLSWILPVWIIFELSMTKLPHYLLPVYPAISILTSAALTTAPSTPDATPGKTQTTILALATGTWLTLGSGLALLAGWLPFALNGTPNPWQGVASAVLIMAQGATLFFFLQKRTIASIASLATGQLIFLTALAAMTLPSLQHAWLSRDIVETADKINPCRELYLVSASYNEPSLVFLAGTQTQIWPNGKYAAKTIEENPCAVALIDQDHLKDFENSFTNNDQKPTLKATLEGRNPANGDRKILSLYTATNPKNPIK